MKNTIVYVEPKDIEIVEQDYNADILECFPEVPDIAMPLVEGAKKMLANVEKKLYSAPALINCIKASLPEETLQAILTDEQKQKIAKGALKLMTKKDGSLMANLVDPKTKKIVSAVSLESVKVAPEIAQAMTSYATQLQMAQIAEQIRTVQIAVEEVRMGQEHDRLAMAYSCQQKLLQAMAISNPELRTQQLLRIAGDAEDCRNLLMQSQTANVLFIKEQPESFWGKLLQGAAPDKINARMNEIRDSLCAVNVASLVEAMAYQEMGEYAAAKKSLEYYADYLNKTYLSVPGLVERLDLIDPSPTEYWSKTLPAIENRIQMLPCPQNPKQIGVRADENKKKNSGTRKNVQKVPTTAS